MHETNRIPVTAAVLAGGRSQRMGVDKTLLLFDGEPLVRRVAETAASVCEHVAVVTNRPEAIEAAGLPPSVRILTDEVAYQGPLGGLVTALAAAEDEWVLAVAADMPWLEPSVIRALWDARAGAQMVMPVGEKGPEPLLALYHVSCLPEARRVLASGRRRLIAIASSVETVEVPLDTFKDVDPGLRSIVNINTPEELLESRDLASDSDEQPATRVSVIEVGTRAARGMPSERPITVFLNDGEIATMQGTPEDLADLGVGFLLSEGFITDREALESVDVDHKRGLVYVRSREEAPPDVAERKRYVTSGCGKGITFASVGHARGIEPVVSDARIGSEQIYDLVGQLARSASSYRDTGGMHSCGIAVDGKLLVVREDVGRHNALDKLFGRIWLDRIDARDGVLLTTGRISYEMAVKAAKARIPIVVSRTAVTDLAVDIAERASLTLVGYARGGKLVVYTNASRINVTSREDD
ncbi:MAG: formate dehydrogenase accessory sulfurtransferase FdhD [Coriobacteriia bacterium]|nr:formate dehydrogenase accessory sulfurtransferase FdhD [Coriobacteriia bacterium]MBN2840899.1 formate dehydrogenase accessory sulfurtransferase FdhD [Coriobacteriia bacterium]